MTPLPGCVREVEVVPPEDARSSCGRLEGVGCSGPEDASLQSAKIGGSVSGMSPAAPFFLLVMLQSEPSREYCLLQVSFCTA